MSFKCYDCGFVFEEPDSWDEGRGEFWGVSCSEGVCGCPKCHGDYGEARECVICGSSFFDEELNGGVCDECLEKYRFDVDMCYKIGSSDTDKVELNCFLSALFSKEEIETILYGVLKEREKQEPVDCMDFIEIDQSWFGERIEEEVIENENGKS